MWSIVVVGRGLPNLTIDFLRTANQTVGDRLVEVVYVDNGSGIEDWNDISQSVLGLTHLVPFKMYRFGSPVCLSRAWNVGLDLASGDRLLVANNDIVFHQPKWLEIFDSALNKKSVGQAGPYHMSWYDAAFVQGSIFAFRREIWELVGQFDERYEFTCEDVDWSKRVQLAGYETICLPDLGPYLTHLGSRTRGAVPEDTTLLGHISRLRYCAKWGLPAKVFD